MDTAGVIYMEGKVKASELIGKVHTAVYSLLNSVVLFSTNKEYPPTNSNLSNLIIIIIIIIIIIPDFYK